MSAVLPLSLFEALFRVGRRLLRRLEDGDRLIDGVATFGQQRLALLVQDQQFSPPAMSSLNRFER